MARHVWVRAASRRKGERRCDRCTVLEPLGWRRPCPGKPILCASNVCFNVVLRKGDYCGVHGGNLGEPQ